MDRPPLEQQFLIAAQGLALLLLCIRLWREGLHKTYVYFFSYLVLALAQVVLGALVPFSSVWYRNVWSATEAIIMCFYAFMVLELYSVALRDLLGLASISRRYIKVTFAIAALAALLPLRAENSPSTMTGFVFIFERPVVSSLVFFVLLLLLFFLYYPVPLTRNVISYLLGYALYFLTKAVTIFFNNVGYYENRKFGDILMGVSLSCLIFWVISLNRRGEKKMASLGRWWHENDEERLLAQLRGLNAGILRAARK